MPALETCTRISFKNILFLTDFGEASQPAQAFALGIARHYGAAIFPAHVANPLVLAETAGAAGLVHEIDPAGWERLDSFVKENPDLSVKPLLAEGSLSAAVQRWTAAHGIDLVVIGTHGRRGLPHFLLGSAAEAIFRTAVCPVLTVGPHVLRLPYQDFTTDTVLFPTDLSHHAEMAAAYAFSFARESGAHIALMHVLPEEARKYPDHQRVASFARKELEKLVPNDAAHWCVPEVLVPEGIPDLEVLEWSESERPDLIVLGLPYKHDSNPLVRTGVTYKIVSAAPCPVLTVRTKAQG